MAEKKKKTVVKKKPKTTSKEKKQPKVKKYYEAVGRRKTSVARVRIFSCSPFEDNVAKIEVNKKLYTKYFPTLELQSLAEAALKKMKSLNRFIVTAMVRGGGLKGQAEAISHGLSRALVKFNPDFRKKLKRAGLLRRDPRMVERKKAGLKKARRAPQWKKR